MIYGGRAAGGGRPESLKALNFTEGFFDVFAVKPLAALLLAQAAMRRLSAWGPPEVLWMRRCVSNNQ